VFIFKINERNVMENIYSQESTLLCVMYTVGQSRIIYCYNTAIIN